MAIIKAVNSRASIGNAINYITKAEKTENSLISGYNCRYNRALADMKATKAAWDKKGGRQYKHFIQSFAPDENITLEEAHKIAQELVESWSKLKGYEVCYATHKDRNHIHTHFIVNSVSFENGKKFSYSKSELQQLKNLSDRIILQHNKTICQKNNNITTNTIGTYKAVEKAVNGNYQSWMLELMQHIAAVKTKAVSISDFVGRLAELGVTVNWQENRKYITFTDRQNHKVRNKKLNEVFKVPLDKEILINEFQSNSRRTAIQRVQLASEIEQRKSNSVRSKREIDRCNREIEQRERGAVGEVEKPRKSNSQIGKPTIGSRKDHSDLEL